MKYLVTGGAGFIGSHIVRRLIKDGHQVVVIDDLSNSEADRVPEGADFVEGSILDMDSLRRALEGCNGVFHLAAEVSVPKSMENPQNTLNVNALGTLRLLEVMHEMDIKKIVYSGTSAAYGDQGDKKHVESMLPQPMSPYAYSKLQGEYFIKTYTHLYDFESVILRYFNVYGEGQRPDSPYAAVIPIFVSRIKAGKDITIFGDGSQTRDFMHVSDVVEANIKSMNSNIKAEVINIGGGKSIDLLELVSILKDICDVPFTVNHDEPREGDIWFSCSDSRKAKELLDFSPKISFRDGLTKLINV